MYICVGGLLEHPVHLFLGVESLAFDDARAEAFFFHSSHQPGFGDVVLLQDLCLGNEHGPVTFGGLGLQLGIDLELFDGNADCSGRYAQGSEFALLDPGIQCRPAYSEELGGFGYREMRLAFEGLAGGHRFYLGFAYLLALALDTHVAGIATRRTAVLLPRIFRGKGAAAAGTGLHRDVHTFYNVWAVMRCETSNLPFLPADWVQVCKST